MAHIIVKVLNFISKFATKIWLRLWSLISFEVLFVHDFSGEEQGVGYMSESAFIYVNLNAYVNWKYDCIFFFLRNLLLMRNGDFKELGVWSCQIKEPKRYNYMVLYLTSMPLPLSLYTICAFQY